MGEKLQDYNLAHAVNCTEHDFTLYDDTGTKVVLVIPPSGTVLRAEDLPRATTRVEAGDAEAVVQIGLPERGPVYPDIPDAPIIVSEVAARAILAHHTPEKPFVHPIWVPCTGPESAVRDEAHRIVGVKSVVLAAPLPEM
jgi:hypothetical protein